MKKFLFLLALYLPSLLVAGAKDADRYACVINDTDGYVFVRSGPGKENPVIDTVYEGWFFEAYGDTSSAWLQVVNPYGKSGYMHRSRVQFFFNLDSASQHVLIGDAFNEIIRAQKGNDRHYRNAVYEGKFIPAYSLLGELFCTHPDTALLCLYFRTLGYLGGSADEGKDWVSAEMWLCKPVEVKLSICALHPDERGCAINSIETGMAMSGKEKLFAPQRLAEMYFSLESPCP